jgi:hypothetical protein
MGRVTLQKNIVNGVNTLTQAMLTQQNTIYVIQYDFTLGENITVPANCVLEFEGGSISGAYTITGTNTCIQAGLVKIFGTDITLAGSWPCDGHARWFGAHPDNADNKIQIQKLFDSFASCIIDDGIYDISDTLTINKVLIIKGSDSSIYEMKTLRFTNTEGKVFIQYVDNGYNNLTIKDVGICGVNYQGRSFVANSVGISITPTTGTTQHCNIDLDNVWLANFEIGVKSNYDSYYNKIRNSRLEHLKTCLYRFHSNNLVIYNNRAETFNTFLRMLYGNGPTSIKNCCFEDFIGSIVHGECYWDSKLGADNLNFDSNYVENGHSALPVEYSNNNTEVFGVSAVFDGVIRNSVFVSNNYQLDNVTTLYNLKNGIAFTSKGNEIILFNDPNNFTYYVYLSRTADSLPKTFKYLELSDSAKWDDSYTFTNYPSIATYYGINGYAIVKGWNPFKKTPYSAENQTNLRVNGPGYTFASSNNAVSNVIENFVFLRGRLQKNNVAVTAPVNGVAELLLDLGVTYSNPIAAYINATDEDGNRVCLKYHYDTKLFDIISGPTTKDIYLDGCTIAIIPI